MRPRGGYDQDPNGDPVTLSGNDCLQLVSRCLVKLDPDELDTFIEGLQNLLQSDGSSLQQPPNGNGNGAGDRGLRPNNRGALDRRLAQDASFAIRARQTESFLERFPFADVHFTGTGGLRR